MRAYHVGQSMRGRVCKAIGADSYLCVSWIVVSSRVCGVTSLSCAWCTICVKPPHSTCKRLIQYERVSTTDVYKRLLQGAQAYITGVYKRTPVLDALHTPVLAPLHPCARRFFSPVLTAYTYCMRQHELARANIASWSQATATSSSKERSSNRTSTSWLASSGTTHAT
jgi:hypothetical protein